MASSMLTSTMEAAVSMEAMENRSDITSCSNDPDFAMICAFLEKFANDLGIELPNFKELQFWLTRNDEVPAQLRDLHIKLLRKTRKIVQEKTWEAAISKFCFTYSTHDAWEIERFGYKNASIKVRLRILKELLESQFERNIKFRAKILSFSADYLRSMPMGRDRLGHTYWMTQDNHCNLRVYQEHLDDEIWQVVATNRDEFANLIKRLKGNEIVEPLTEDIDAIDEDTATSYSSTTKMKLTSAKDGNDETFSNEDEVKLPNIRIKFNTLQRANPTDGSNDAQVEEFTCKLKENVLDENAERTPDIDINTENDVKKHKKTNCINYKKIKILKRIQRRCQKTLAKIVKYRKLIKRSYFSNSKLIRKINQNSKSERRSSFTGKHLTFSKGNKQQFRKEICDAVSPVENVSSLPCEKIDSTETSHVPREKIKTEKEEEASCLKEEKKDDENAIGEPIEESLQYVNGAGSGNDSESINNWLTTSLVGIDHDDDEQLIVGDIIEEAVVHIHGEGLGFDCLVGSDKCDEGTVASVTPNSKEDLSLKNVVNQSADKPEIMKKSSIDDSINAINETQALEQIENNNLKEEENKLTNTVAANTAIHTNGEDEESKFDSNLNTSSLSNSSTKECNNKTQNSEETITENQGNPKDTDSKQNCNELIQSDPIASDTVMKGLSEDLPEENVENCPQINVPKTTNENSPNSVVIVNRKRRLEEISETSMKCSRNSISEYEMNTDNQEEFKRNENVPDDLEVGGKRLKMRPRKINTKLRQKIAAQKLKSRPDGSTSSSGEEIENEYQENNSNEAPSSIASNLTKSNLKMPTDLDVKQCNSTSTAMDMETNSNHLKHKQSLEEIIEKKFKKNEESSEPSSEASTVLPTNDSKSIINFAPLKRSLITKPLKKNLLTKLQQEALDDDSEMRSQSSNSTEVPVAQPLEASTQRVHDPALDVKLENRESLANNTESPTETLPKEDIDDSPLELVVKAEPESIPQNSPAATQDISIAEPKEIEESTTNIKDKLTATEAKPTEKTLGEISETECTLTEDNPSCEKALEEETTTVKVESLDTVKKPNSPMEDEKEDIKISEPSKECKSDENLKNEETLDVNETKLLGRRRSCRHNSTPIAYVELPQKSIKPRGRGKKLATKQEVDLKENETKSEQKLVDEKNIKESSVSITSEENVPLKMEKEIEGKDKSEITKSEVVLKDVKLEEKTDLDEVMKNEEEKQDDPVKQLNESSTKTESDLDQSKILPDNAEKSNDIGIYKGAVARGKGSRKKREVDTKNIIESTDTETPVRQSRRIAQQKIREEAERRKLEEIALRTMKQEFKKKKKAEKEVDVKVKECISESTETEVDSVAEVKKKKIQKRKYPGKNGSWSSDSEDQDDEPDEEDEEPMHYDTDPCSPLFKSDHEFSPESDLEDSIQAVPLKRARTARKETSADSEDVEEEEEACQKCGKSDHPEWILLCDNCDKGYHCSCLSPVLFYIPEGNWYCPTCEQNQLINALEHELEMFDNRIERKNEQEEERKLIERERIVQQTKLAAMQEMEEPSEKSDLDVYEKKMKKSRGGLSRADRCRRRANIPSSDSQSVIQTDSATSQVTSSEFSESDNEPIYKLRKRQQINVSYRLNEYDDLINSALKKEMDEAAGASNLGRGKDMSTIIKAGKEKSRAIELEEAALEESMCPESGSKLYEGKDSIDENNTSLNASSKHNENTENDVVKQRSKPVLKKKTRKLTTLDITSEEDDASDEDFKTSSFEEDEEEETGSSASLDSDSILENYRRKASNKHKKRHSTRRRNHKFVVDESDEDDINYPQSKKKQNDDSDFTDSDAEYDELSDVTDNIDSADLCDDTSTESSDHPWQPSKYKKKNSKSDSTTNTSKTKTKTKKTKTNFKNAFKNSDSESLSTLGDGQNDSEKHEVASNIEQKQLSISNDKPAGSIVKPKKKVSEDEYSLSDSGDSARRTRGRRYAYIEDFEEESSDGGIKPGVLRPDTPPEEREQFIKRQEEIKRMIAEKNTNSVNSAAAEKTTAVIPSSAPAKAAANEKEKKSHSKTANDSLSTVPISVIRQAKALDIDYLQRKGEPVEDIENDVGDVDEFDDNDLPDDLPEDMDEDAIARMVEEEESFSTISANKELPSADDILKASLNKSKHKEIDKLPVTTNQSVITSVTHAIVTTASPKVATITTLATATLSASILSTTASTPTLTATPTGLQEPNRKKLPIPTPYPPLLRHQFPIQNSEIASQIMQHITYGNPTHMLQSALSAPLTQSIRNYSKSSVIKGERIPNNILTQSPTPHLIDATNIKALINQEATAAVQTMVQNLTTTTTPITSLANDPKPRGRRKKITPLRDPMQKQQIANAVSAAAVISTSNTIIEKLSSSVSTSKSVIPNAMKVASGIPSALPLASISSLPQLTQPNRTTSAIVSMPLYHGGDGFYEASSNTLATLNPHVPPSTLTRLLPAHAVIRSTYRSPPPLKAALTSTITSNITNNVRPSFITSSATSTRGHLLPPFVGHPPSSRTSNIHLNPYRQIYGNPNFAPPPRMPTIASNIRSMFPPSHSRNYSSSNFPPYAYYPPPPPLTPQMQIQQKIPHTSAAHTQATVPSAPSASTTSVIVAPRFDAQRTETSISASLSSSSSSRITPTSSAPSALPSSSSIIKTALKSTIPVLNATTNKSSNVIKLETRSADSPPPPPCHPLNNNNNQIIIMESPKKLTPLDAYNIARIVKPSLPLNNDSLNSRMSSALQMESASSDSPPSTAMNDGINLSNNAVDNDGGDGDGDDQVSEFSGLVSYFSSQHDDYNT